MEKEFQDLSSTQLQTFIKEHKEGTYVLVDVRQPEEYQAAHIPGGQLIPLGNLEAALPDLPADLPIVFYCRSGNRSRVAALLAASAKRFKGELFNLAGGIRAYQGKTLADFPKVELFDIKAGWESLCRQAMNLEKGAGHYYRTAAGELAAQGMDKTINELAVQEETHARTVYELVGKKVKLPPFEMMYGELPGNMVEGGFSVEELMGQLRRIEGGFCLNFFELALEMESRAFDLYRNLAEMAEDESTREALLSLSQAEKNHMRWIAQSLKDCPAV